METARSLRYVVTRTVGPASSARRELSAGTVRTKATHGILVPSLVLAALGTVAAASPGHVSIGHVHSGVVFTPSCRVGSRPWMLGVPSVSTRPWMLRAPWMLGTPAVHTRPWMLRTPWM